MLKRYFRLTLLILIISTLYACATRGKYVEQQKSWINKNVTEYTQQFGYPNSVINVSQNPNIETYVYVMMAVNPESNAEAGSSLNSLMMANRDPEFTQFGALKCTTWVSFNKKTKIITNITFRGNYCATSN